MRAIVTGFKRLADFKGRDARSRFWPYALTVVAICFAGLWLGLTAVNSRKTANLYGSPAI